MFLHHQEQANGADMTFSWASEHFLVTPLLAATANVTLAMVPAGSETSVFL